MNFDIFCSLKTTMSDLYFLRFLYYLDSFLLVCSDEDECSHERLEQAKLLHFWTFKKIEFKRLKQY
jgi:hypothetical protein